jgi:methionyl-tRNA formyltransferase
MDLLLPGSAEGLAHALPGYQPDIVICNGMPWKIPPVVLAIPRLGFVNIHSSLLPRYRGPIPIHWAIRSGDAETGVTIHWMDETFDTGPVIARSGGIPIEDEFDPDGLLDRVEQAGVDLLRIALDRIRDGAPGEPQGNIGASYAGWMEPEFYRVDWSHGAREIHNQVRTFQFGVVGASGPLAEVGGVWVTVLRTRLEPVDGTRVECADGPIWIVESEPADPPSS